MSAVDDARKRLKGVYDPARFLRTGETLMGALREYLQDSLAGASSGPLPDPETLIEKAGDLLDQGSSPHGVAALYLSHCRRLHSPHYLGHQVPPPVPDAGLFELLGKVTNQGGAVYEMGPLANAAERAVIRRLLARIGWLGGGEGIVTHGGTIANLTALLAARNRRFPDAWKKGTPPGAVIFATTEAHYSISRALGILGLGTDALRPVPVDGRYRMDPRALGDALKAARAKGETPVAVVATSGSTPVGSFDDLIGLSDVTSAQGVWLHVDAAHGGSVFFSSQHKSLVEGWERADSITWDAHKMLYVPSLCTFLLYRRGADALGAFSQDAPYLLDPEARRLAPYDMATRTLECTRGSVSVPLWAVWACLGEKHFADLVDVTFDATRVFHGLLEKSGDFEPLHEPQGNILCFRYKGTAEPGDARSALQLKIRRKVVDQGDFYLTTARLQGEMVLRVTVMNPFTETPHFTSFLEALRGAAQEA